VTVDSRLTDAMDSYLNSLKTRQNEDLSYDLTVVKVEYNSDEHSNDHPQQYNQHLYPVQIKEEQKEKENCEQKEDIYPVQIKHEEEHQSYLLELNQQNELKHQPYFIDIKHEQEEDISTTDDSITIKDEIEVLSQTDRTAHQQSSSAMSFINPFAASTDTQFHICNYCTCAFTSRGELMAHKRTHTEERPHICYYCNRGFALKGHLNEHIKIHSGTYVPIVAMHSPAKVI